MSRRKPTPIPDSRSESDSEPDEVLIVVEAYIDACEMYLEAFKLTNKDEISYSIGMKGIYFAKAALAYTEVGNKEILKSSVKHAVKACTEAINHFESKHLEEGVYFIKSAKLVVLSLTDLK